MKTKNTAGVVNLHKPAGISSRAAVDTVKRLVRPAKTGHAGTLDPLACGVLVICVGTATRLIEYVQELPKCYTGTFLLGRESDTEDIEGEVRMLPAANIPSHNELSVAAARLVGQIEQRPPVFSALKVRGRRAYDLARAGEQVELAPRPVTIYRLEIVRYAYPELTLDVECGSGTYIRSLGRDLAENVGTAAVMSSLTRTAIGPFRLAEAWPPERLSRETLADWLQPPLAAVPLMERITLSAAELERLGHGMPIERAMPGEAREIAGLDESADLRAILSVELNGTLRPLRNIARRHE
ncbi:MAG TPA: tRNA pseudouridine(55) synthase TruB [Pirellulales bacterium]